jgi:PAS domain S-box-containing protein
MAYRSPSSSGLNAILSKGPARYAFAVALVLCALGLNLLPEARALPFLFFFAAVALSARFFGFGPSLLATLCSAVVADYFLIPPRLQWSFDPPNLIKLFLFAIVAVLISSLAKQKSELQRASDEDRNRLAAIVESSEDAVYSKTLDGVITSWNQGAEKLFGYTREEAVGKDVSLIAPGRTDEIRQILSLLKTGGRIAHQETQRVTKAGKTLDISISISPVMDADGNIIGAASIARDITARKIAEKQIYESEAALRSTQQRLQFAQQAANLGSWEWNLKTNELWWSDGIAPLHGCAVGSVQPTFENWVNFVVPEDQQKIEAAVQDALAGRKEYNVEYRCLWPDGSLHWIVARGQASFDDQGNPEKMVGVGIDVTERKFAEETLRRTEKLAAAGRLAASIAHEINNPLEAITNLMYLMRRNNSLDERARRHLSVAEQELDRLAHITKQTLGFYRDSTAAVQINLPRAADEVIALYSRRMESQGISLEKDYQADPQVVGFEGEVRQVLSNLIVNALDAMTSGGRLRVRIRATHEWGNSQRPGISMTVADTGCGITAEQQKKIFEPFFTTKKDIGTGLGLWISREIVQKHGGSIRLRSSSTPGHSGTVFSVFLPDAADQALELNSKSA